MSASWCCGRLRPVLALNHPYRSPVQRDQAPWDNGNGTSTLRITDINSVLGRASLRIGTSRAAGNFTWQPFLAATILHEFAGGRNLNPVDKRHRWCRCRFRQGGFTTVTDRVGTYEQTGFGTAVAAGNTGWLGYGRGDVKFGENIQGWGVNFGLRYQCSGRNSDPLAILDANTWAAPPS